MHTAMDLLDLIHRQPVPAPWSEGDKIPWNDEAFSRRMLREHLSQDHDMASRRTETIDAHVAWLHRSVLSGHPTRILDLGCGPGLYTHRLAQLGHECVGIDFSPASVAYASERARTDGLHCSYRLEDIRTAEYGQGYGLVMLIFGEFNTFRPAEARAILVKAYGALDAKGQLVLEVHTFAAVRTQGEHPPSWYSSESGLFSDRPHLCLTENFWDADQNVATTRFIILDAATAAVTRCAESLQAYTDAQYQALLQECGFEDITFYPSLKGTTDASQLALFAIVGRKQ